MPVNWKGRVAIRDVSRRSRGDFQLHELVDLIPSPCVVFDLAPLLLARGSSHKSKVTAISAIRRDLRHHDLGNDFINNETVN